MDMFPSNKNFKVLDIEHIRENFQILKGYEMNDGEIVTMIACNCSNPKIKEKFAHFVDLYINNNRDHIFP